MNNVCYKRLATQIHKLYKQIKDIRNLQMKKYIDIGLMQIGYNEFDLIINRVPQNWK